MDTYTEAQQYGATNGETEWQAHHWLGGNGPSSNYDMYSCWDGVTPQKMYGPTWVARSSTSTLSGLFSVGGVGLDTSQENSGYHKLTWGPDVWRIPEVACPKSR